MIDEVAWYAGNSGQRVHPVKTKKANELGIYDMSGSVWEWCQDWYGDYGSVPRLTLQVLAKGFGVCFVAAILAQIPTLIEAAKGGKTIRLQKGDFSAEVSSEND